MYASEEQGLCLIQTKFELHKICSSFRFYNSAGKYILVERMIIILLRIYYLSIFLKKITGYSNTQAPSLFHTSSYLI